MRSGIYFVFVTKDSRFAPALVIELLNKMIKTMRDFCGVLSEESLRRNFVLIYELVDEAIDAGYPQTTASEILKLSIRSDAIEPVTVPVPLSLSSIPNPFKTGMGSSQAASTIPSSANQRPIGITTSGSPLPNSIGGLTLPANFSSSISGLLGRDIPGLTTGAEQSQKNEIFVDIIERLSAITRVSDGELISCHIDGSIQMKSYLSGTPMLRLCLNEDLIISTEESNHQRHSSSSSSVLDDVLFHESADLSEFDSGRIISILPPDGEFVLMNYRISNFNRLPFRVHPSVTSTGGDRVDVSIVVRADIPEQNHASNLVVTLHLPTAVRSVTGIHGGSSGEFTENKITWTVKKLTGNQEVVCRARILLGNPVDDIITSFSHVTLGFEVPMYSLSNMQVKYLRIQSQFENGSSPSSGPYRWVRYVTQSQSYSTR
jgi:AP-4 complex subunit mu-1